MINIVISKDDLSSLDLGRYLGEIVIVDTEYALNKACEEIENVPLLVSIPKQSLLSERVLQIL